MRRRRLVSLALALSAIAGLAIAHLARPLQAEVAGPIDAPDQAEASACDVMGSPWRDAEYMLLGETVEVTYNLGESCPGRGPFPVDVVFAIDTSLTPRELGPASNFAVQVISDLNLRWFPNTRIGVVAVDSDKRVTRSLTNEETDAISNVRPRGGGSEINLERALEEAGAMLRENPNPREAGVEAEQIVVLMTDAKANVVDPEGEVEPDVCPRRQAQDLARSDIRLVTVCAGDCNRVCLSTIATSGADFIQTLGNHGGLTRLVSETRSPNTGPSISDIQIVHRLPADQTLLPESIRLLRSRRHVEPRLVEGANGSRQIWDNPGFDDGDLVISFKVRPERAGQQDLGRGLDLRYTDSQGGEGFTYVEPPKINVFGPLVPTPTPEPGLPDPEPEPGNPDPGDPAPGEPTDPGDPLLKPVAWLFLPSLRKDPWFWDSGP